MKTLALWLILLQLIGMEIVFSIAMKHLILAVQALK
jgi:hypothetical protein